MRLTRRQMVVGSILGTGALSVVGGGLLWRRSIQKIVYGELSYLNLDPAGVEAFSNDALRELLDRLSGLADAREVSDPLARRRAIADWFLLSSDFFTHGMDEARVVRYTRLYDPLLPCSNPFAVTT